MIPKSFLKTLSDIENLSNTDCLKSLEKISNLIKWVNLFYPLGDIEEQNDLRFAMLDAAMKLKNHLRLKNGLSRQYKN